MRVVIAGGHGKIALLLERLLAERGDQAVGLIRNRAHVADVQKTGAEAVVCDLEATSADDVAVLLSGADAVVFAAGEGQTMKGISILVDRLYSGYESGKRRAMERSSTTALYRKYAPSNITAASQYRLTAIAVPIIARIMPE